MQVVDRIVSETSKFPALRVVASLLRLVAVLEAVLGLLTTAITAWTAASVPSLPQSSGFLFFLIGAVSVAWKVLLLLAVAEAIGVFIAIEENTRRTTDAMPAKTPVTEPASERDADEPPAKAKRFVTCESCGKKTEADSLFCQKCGHAIGGG